MYELTDEWFEQINEEFREKEIPDKQRPWLAWSEWSKHIGLSTSFDDADVKRIFEWAALERIWGRPVFRNCIGSGAYRS